jgi:hypothetical protein
MNEKQRATAKEWLKAHPVLPTARPSNKGRTGM